MLASSRTNSPFSDGFHEMTAPNLAMVSPQPRATPGWTRCEDKFDSWLCFISAIFSLTSLCKAGQQGCLHLLSIQLQ